MRTKLATLLIGVLLVAPVAAGRALADEPRRFVTEHALDVGDQTLAYRALVEETQLRRGDDGVVASFYTVAYVLDSVDGEPVERGKRPVTFLFNGGPGSSAVWLHLGAFGPRRIAMGDDGFLPAGPPHALGPNEHTLLPFTDLVFVDPVGTGYSRAVGAGNDEDYWGVDEDAASVARLIRSWLRTHDRRRSPRYLLGESYGTIRATVLVRELMLRRRNRTSLDGVILLSTAIDPRIFQSGRADNELVYVTNLPTYAVTAYHHNRLPQMPDDRDAFLEEVREFASTEYLTALFKGNALPRPEAKRIAGRLAEYTGLSEALLLQRGLRIDGHRFAREFTRERGGVMASYDTRFIARDNRQAAGPFAFDPFLAGITGPFTTTMKHYLEDDLGVDVDRPYQIFEMAANTAWRRSARDEHVFAGYMVVSPYLMQAARRDGDFRVFAASGYHDLTTTFFGVEHTFDHSGVPRRQLTLRNYDGGHMMYLHDPTLEAMTADLRAFYEGK